MGIFHSVSQSTKGLSEFDLIIIGSGPAGMTIAAEFQHTSVKVALLESGDFSSDPKTEALNDFENLGHRRAPSSVTRRRGVGGTSALWTGRCGSFDQIDFQHRPWVPLSGWPIEIDDVSLYFARAGQKLGLAPPLTQRQAMREMKQDFDHPGWNGQVFQPAVWQFSLAGDDVTVRNYTPESEMNGEDLAILHHTGATTAIKFGETNADWLAASDNVDLFMNTTVTEIIAKSDGTAVTGVAVRGLDGLQAHLYAGKIILACGGIENARLLLASRTSVPVGLGNHNDQVGRYLTDHTFTELGIWSSGQAKALRRRMGSRYYARAGQNHVYNFGLRLAPEIQQREGLLNAAAHMAEFGTTQNALSSIASAVRGLRAGGLSAEVWQDLLSGLRRPVDLAEGINDRFLKKRAQLNAPDRIVVGCVIEQPVQADSRITLSGSLDQFGSPLPMIDWRISDEEYGTAVRFRGLFLEELTRLGLEHPTDPDWVAQGQEVWRNDLIDLAHPMCSTRMSDDPGQGVVDKNSQVHDIKGLYVTGGSIFSTPGHMNPTQMIVSLALRLADHIKSDPTRRLPPAQVSAKPRAKVGIIGAGHRMETVYQPAIKALHDRIDVVGITSAGGDSARRLSAQTGWPVQPDLETMVAKTRPDFLIVATSASQNDSVYPGICNTGLPVLLETPVCWNLRHGRAMARKTRRLEQIVGIAEQFPFFPIAQMHRKLIDLGVIGQPQAVINHFAIFDYHGIARLREGLNSSVLPASVTAAGATLPSAFSPLQGGPEYWEQAQFRYADGRILQHHYSDTYFETAFRKPKTFTVYGTQGTLSDEVVLYADAEGSTVQCRIERVEHENRLVALSAKTLLGKVLWNNPFADHALDDEQIAVASLVENMADAALHGGTPIYDITEGQRDIEMLNGMRASVRRGGRPVRLPVSPGREKLRRVVLRRIGRD